ncbi:hypothetical protein HMPREF1531_02066 [Propionibacterium sp. oral taxon 192 str. F0372]|uniref:hypothetical protein n=1 Tax=Propionibacterium sp. oral taxon 192 TaxID=671222 RepID=UPI00035281A6|nr:hypothetical protein [Propionibacterium sp. oral taxon 192]EPH02755.1 hypothetical protein HMPREF1531_02066 [Propionibacterium sp. oral taxon 192 str. F0372]
MSVKENFGRWVNTRSSVDRRALQKSIVRDPRFTRELAWQSRAEQLLADDRWDEVIRLVEFHMPGAFLSPVAHRLLAIAREEIYDSKGARAEWDLVHLSLIAIDESGNGNYAKPWQVFHVADEYALLSWKELTPEAQRCILTKDGIVDVITCTDGSERWFRLI